MATSSSILAWKIPWTETPGGLQSMGLQRAGHDWVTEHSTAQYELGVVDREEQQNLLKLCVPLIPYGPANICVQALALFHLPVNCLPSLWSPKVPIHFCFKLKVVFKARILAIFKSCSVFSRSLPCVHVINLLFDFSPIYLSHASLILRTARRT